MREKHNPVGYIKVFKESMVQADREHRVQSGNTESGWENVLLLGGADCHLSKSDDKNGTRIHCELLKFMDINLGKYSSHSVNHWYR